MPNTPRGAPYPVLGDAPNGPAEIQALAEWNDLSAFVMQGARASRPAASDHPFTFYFGTDVHSLWFSNGTSWEPVGPGTGEYKFVAYSTVDPGWLAGDGSAVSRTGANADLFTKLGTGYGAGNGTTTFNVPDIRGRTLVGADGTAGRLTASDALGNSGGQEKHTLDEGEMPSHRHTFDNLLAVYPTGANALASGSVFQWLGGGSAGTDDTGGDQPHNNMQPYMIGNPLIKL